MADRGIIHESPSSTVRRSWTRGNGDIDYRQVAAYLKQSGLRPLLVVELAYKKETAVTRSLEEDLQLSRKYAERVFGVSA